MTDLLDRTVKTALGDIVAHTPNLGPTPTEFLIPLDASSRRRPFALAAAAVLAVAGVAGIGALALRRDPAPNTTTSPTGTGPTTAAEELQPAATLPDTPDVADVPVTVAAGAPTSWYRLQPDLDIAWQATSDGTTEFCWRTPIGDQCQPDGPPDQLAIPTAGGQTLVITTNDTSSPTLDVQLSDGTIRSAPISWDDDIGWGVARFELPNGTSVEAAGAATAGNPEADTVTGQTLPPTVDLIEVPLTVPAGSALNYWRFLPDLDISERQTASGDTELCWRTPAATGCIDDTFESPGVGIIPTDGAAIFLVRPALIPIDPPPTDPLAPTLQVGPNPTNVDVTFSDGTAATVNVRHGETFGIGYGRIDIPAGLTISTATSS